MPILYIATGGKDEDAPHVEYGGPCEVLLILYLSKQHNLN